MTTRYVTEANVRTACGITTTFISDADMTELCEYTEYNVERFMNASFVPVTTIEQFEGNNSERLVVLHNPILKIRALTIDDTSITPDKIRTDKEAGVIWLSTDAETSYFKVKTSERNLVRIKYDYGYLQATSTQTTFAAASIAGNSVNVEVASSTGILVDDYVEIQGLDSRQETVKVTVVPDGTHLTFDNLAYTHENGSLVTLQMVPPVAERLMIIACAMAAVARVVGQSYDEITGYGIGDINVQKGEPYTQWREVTTQLRKEWKDLLQSFRIRTCIR